jgi:hypothetical protein
VRYETPDMVQLDLDGVPKVQMRQTSIYARRIFTAFTAPMVKVSGKAEEIDIEPDVAVAPDGTTFIVWVNDPIHDDLVEENTGREILHSTHLGNNVFSAPAPVLADPLPFKGLLEPDIGLGSTPGPGWPWCQVELEAHAGCPSGLGTRTQSRNRSATASGTGRYDSGSRVIAARPWERDRRVLG